MEPILLGGGLSRCLLFGDAIRLPLWMMAAEAALRRRPCRVGELSLASRLRASVLLPPDADDEGDDGDDELSHADQ